MCDLNVALLRYIDDKTIVSKQVSSALRTVVVKFVYSPTRLV